MDQPAKSETKTTRPAPPPARAGQVGAVFCVVFVIIGLLALLALPQSGYGAAWFLLARIAQAYGHNKTMLAAADRALAASDSGAPRS